MTKVIISGANVVLTTIKGVNMYTANQVAKLSGVKNNTIYHNRKKPGYPKGVEQNGRVYFTEKDAQFFIKACSVYRLTDKQIKGLKDGSILKHSNAAKYLGVSSQTLTNFQKLNDNTIPCVHKKNYVLYEKKDLDKFKESGRKIKNERISSSDQKEKWAETRKQTSDPRKDTLIKPLVYPEHECSRHGCTKKTTNRFLCDECKREFSGECGDSFHSPPRRTIGGAL